MTPDYSPENGAICDGRVSFVSKANRDPPVSHFPNIYLSNCPYGGVTTQPINRDFDAYRAVGQLQGGHYWGSTGVITEDSNHPSLEQLPIFDFRAVSLTKASREQLARIYESVRAKSGAAVSERISLRNLIAQNLYDPIRGIYLPTSANVYLVGKLPTVSEQLSHLDYTTLPIRPFRAVLFTNALMIPSGYGTAQFNPDDASAPKTRLTNIGFLIVTIEYDCDTSAEFEEILSWTRGEADKSPFAKADRELARTADYRGYCIVLSGSRSIHFHCLFSTEHLTNAPYDAPAELRLASFREQSALVENAHRIYWDHVDAVFKSVLKPSLASDTQLRHATQWRRSPWGIRTLDKDSNILGLPKGICIPQIVIRENIRIRAARGANDYLVPASFSITHPISSLSDTPRHEGNIVGGDGSQLVSLLQDECRSEWGEYPRPVEVTPKNGDWVIKFRNHPGDNKPSTIVVGHNRRLLLQGRHDFGDHQFYLPDHMTANEMIDNLLRRTGQAPITAIRSTETTTSSITEPTTSSWSHVSILDEYADKIRRSFSEPLSDKPLHNIANAYRGKLWDVFAQCRDWSDKTVIISGEGIGKTSKLRRLLLLEAQDDARSDGIERFAGFAFRSHQQAERKAQEFRNDGYCVLVWRSFWDHYKEACNAENQQAICRDEFADPSPTAILLRIFQEQPRVFERLERVRKTLWASSAKYSAYSTILVMTHRAAETWDTGLLTRAWHHPDFDPFAPMDEYQSLRDRIRLTRVVLDDPEADDFLYTLPESSFEFLQRQQKRNSDWRNRSHDHRVSVYLRLKAKKELPGNLFAEFESFDELMRVDLTTLDMVQVDCDKIPFGYDRSSSGIYRERHGDKYYIGAKPWLFASDRNVTVLTTETLVADTVIGVTNRYRDKGGETKQPFRLQLDNMPGIYPIKLPTFIDRRARKGGVRTLAQEILGSNTNAIVISDMVKNVPAVMTFQGMKGVNELQGNDVYIVVTCLSPPKYAELNALGRWLEIPNIIQNYYQDQINQAVGRNRGFRQSSERETKTVLVTSRRLWKSVLSGLLNKAPRVQLYEITDKP